MVMLVAAGEKLYVAAVFIIIQYLLMLLANNMLVIVRVFSFTDSADGVPLARFRKDDFHIFFKSLFDMSVVLHQKLLLVEGKCFSINLQDEPRCIVFFIVVKGGKYALRRSGRAVVLGAKVNRYIKFLLAGIVEHEFMLLALVIAPPPRWMFHCSAGLQICSCE
jgi:hypothetical protein